MGVGLRVERGSGGFRVESGVIHPGWVDARIMVLLISYYLANGRDSLHSIFGEFGFSLHTDSYLFFIFDPDSSPLGSVSGWEKSCSLYQNFVSADSTKRSH
jgi:hypothetical protein